MKTMTTSIVPNSYFEFTQYIPESGNHHIGIDVESFSGHENLPNWQGWQRYSNTRMPASLDISSEDVIKGKTSSSYYGSTFSLEKRGLNIDASQNGTVMVDFSTTINTPASLYWQKDGEVTWHKMTIPSLIADGQSHQYPLAVYENPNWTGTITALRFEPAIAVNTVFEIEGIAVQPSVGSLNPAAAWGQYSNEAQQGKFLYDVYVDGLNRGWIEIDWDKDEGQRVIWILTYLKEITRLS